MEKFNKEFLKRKNTVIIGKSFVEIKERFFEYAKKHGFRENLAGEMFMRINRIEEIYYFILMNDPLMLGTLALDAIYRCNLYKRYGFCEEETSVIKWIDSLSREEYYFMASQILLKQPGLIDIEVNFNGPGYYTMVTIPSKYDNKICVKEIEEIKNIYDEGKI